MIFLLLITTLILMFISYKVFVLKFVSPSFIVSTMFFLSSLIYCVTYEEMLNDISFLTYCFIVSFIMIVMVAEFLVFFLFFKNKKYNSFSKNNRIYCISKKKIIFFTLIFIGVAFMRFLNLKSLVQSHGGDASNIFNLMSQARLIYVREKENYILGNFFENQFVYICEIFTYICIYIYLNNVINFKNVEKGRSLKLKKYYVFSYYLLPLIPYLIICLFSTGRTNFIVLFFSILLFYSIIQLKRTAFKKIKIPFILIPITIILVVLFLVYGRIRNDAFSIPFVNYIQMYTCSSLYGLDYFLTKGIVHTPYFGYYTLQDFYSFFSISHTDIPSWYPNFVFNVSNDESNIYTSLAHPYADYGFAGLMFLRFMATFITSFLLYSFCLKRKNNWFSMSFLIFIVYFLYCHFYSSTGDVYCSIFLNPLFIIRNYLYSLFTSYFLLKKCSFKKRKYKAVVYEISRNCCNL